MEKINGHGFAFLCMAPDVNFARNVPFVMNFDTNEAFYRMLSGMGLDVKPENFRFYGPEWNNTVYSSHLARQEGEFEDLKSKIIKVLETEGVRYNGEDIQSLLFAPSSQFAECSYFLAWLQTNE